MGIVVEDKEAGVDNGLADKRDVVQHVLGLLDAGGSIDIAAEGGADALKPVEDALAGEILGAVEAHVLEEVSQSVLVGLFLDSTYVGGEVELGTLLGLFVMTDVIGQAVLKFTRAHCRVVGKLLELLRAGERKRGDEQGSDKEKSFHLKKLRIRFMICKPTNLHK